jgi:Transposase DDE domain
MSFKLSTLTGKVRPAGLGREAQWRARPRQLQADVPRQTEFVICDETIKGRKRHLMVDTLGLPLSFYVTPANVHDTFGARCLLAGLRLCLGMRSGDLACHAAGQKLTVLAPWGAARLALPRTPMQHR